MLQTGVNIYMSSLPSMVYGRRRTLGFCHLIVVAKWLLNASIGTTMLRRSVKCSSYVRTECPAEVYLYVCYIELCEN